MPYTIDRTAPAFAERQRFIAAPRERVWELLADVENWPRWRSGVSKARIEGPPEEGTRFRWKAGGVRITSELRAVTPPVHIAWEGKAVGLCALHGWYLYRHPNGTVVLTAESFDGALARLLRPLMQRRLNRTLSETLTDLGRAAETPT